jgi:hypothetical protein
MNFLQTRSLSGPRDQQETRLNRQDAKGARSAEKICFVCSFVCLRVSVVPLRVMRGWFRFFSVLRVPSAAQVCRILSSAARIAAGRATGWRAARST